MNSVGHNFINSWQAISWRDTWKSHLLKGNTIKSPKLCYFWYVFNIRQILTFHLVALLLLSNVGIPVFTHVCHSKDKTWSSIIVPAKSCCSKKKHKSITLPCHNPINPNKPFELAARPCCENQQDLLQLSVDFLQSQIGISKSDHIDQVIGDFAFANDEFVQLTLRSSDSHRPHGPPRTVHGKTMLVLHQVFRC